MPLCVTGQGGGRGRRREGRWTEMGGRKGEESCLVLSLMRILINPAEAALRPPRFIRPEKPDCQKRRGRREGWDHAAKRKRKRQKFLAIDEVEKCQRGGRERQKSKRRVQGETGRGERVGGWPAEITVWVIGRVTAAIDPLIGCLTVSTRLPNPLIRGVSSCVCLCECVKTTTICAICSPCLCHQN